VGEFYVRNVPDNEGLVKVQLTYAQSPSIKAGSTDLILV
jgi:hypothetical protein